MSANLAEVVLLGALNEQLILPAASMIGGIQVDTTIEEFYEDTVEFTDQPVQTGANITDHSFKKPMELVLSCGWSDSSSSGFLGGFGSIGLSAISPALSGIVGAAAGISGLLNPGAGNAGAFSGGSMVASDYVAGIYSQLLQMQEARQPIIVVSGLRSYTSMGFGTIRVRRDPKTSFALMVQAFFRQLILVDTQQSTVAPQANQAIPASTADIVNAGAQQLQSAAPSAAGAMSPLTVILPPVQGIAGLF
jgi:Dit-like tail protein